MMLTQGPMKKARFLVSVTTDDNDYQIEQAVSAEETARKLGVEVKILHAGNDAINQSQQLLKVIQSRTEAHPDAIVFEPAGGTALPQVARAAAQAGIGWVVLNRDVDYIAELRRTCQAPIFAITADHEEIGRIQGRQLGALLPKGGSVLLIQGPSESTAARQRTAGMYETKPDNIDVKTLRGQWTEGSAYRVVSSWLRLSTSQQAKVDAIAAQDDSMAVGAKKAFQDHTTGSARDQWLSLPFLGCDGLPKTGQAWVRSSLLAATVVVPANTGLALQLLMKAMQSGKQPAERTLTRVESFPAIEILASARARSAGA